MRLSSARATWVNYLCNFTNRWMPSIWRHCLPHTINNCWRRTASLGTCRRVCFVFLTRHTEQNFRSSQLACRCSCVARAGGVRGAPVERRGREPAAAAADVHHGERRPRGLRGPATAHRTHAHAEQHVRRGARELVRSPHCLAQLSPPIPIQPHASHFHSLMNSPDAPSDHRF